MHPSTAHLAATASTPRRFHPDPVAPTGYRHPDYAAALGALHPLPQAGTWLVVDSIPGIDARDARGCYPLFACARWEALAADLDALDDGIVSVAVVTDPFGSYRPSLLARAFPDLARPFKEHFVVDLARPLDTVASAHHRRNARRAARAVEVERLAEPSLHAPEWCALYANLVRRHAIRGPAAFSARSFAAQLRVPGIVAFRARAGGTTVGMTLWYLQDGVAYYHLGAYADRGYELGASFALFRAALAALREEAAWASLGAGLDAGADDGLARFKAGWATGTRTAWFCGRILDRARYAALVRRARAGASGYFPAYRCAEAR